MSGIEAVVGVVASGAGLLSLAIQLGESVRKLRDFCHAAKNAPETLSDLIFDLETMTLSLQQLERHRQHDSHDIVHLDRCISRTRKSTAKIQEAVEKMEHYLARSEGAGKLYTAFKGKRVNQMFEELEQAKSSLMLTYQVYCQSWRMREAVDHGTALQAHRDVLIGHSAQLGSIEDALRTSNAYQTQQWAVLMQQPAIREVPGNPNAPQTPPSSELVARSLSAPHAEEKAKGHDSVDRLGSTASKTAIRRRKKKQRTYFQVGFSMPGFLSAASKVWHLAAVEAESGWDICLRTYYRRPGDSKIFKLCRRGDLCGIQELISSGQASLTDVDEHGSTLLWYSAISGRIDICRWILGQGIWLDGDGTLRKALIWTAINQRRPSTWEEYAALSKEAEQAYRLFVEGFDLDLDIDHKEFDEPDWRPFTICRNIECLEILMRNQTLLDLSFSLAERFELADGMSGPPSLSLRVLGLPSSDSRLARLRTQRGSSLLHHVGRHLGYYGNPLYEKLWHELGKSLIASGVDPSLIAVTRVTPGRRATPLLECLSSFWEPLESPTKCLERVRRWVSMVKSAGLSLSQYGRQETEAWTLVGAFEAWYGTSALEGGDIVFKRLIYGNEPEDWSVEIERRELVPIYTLNNLPGAFPERLRLPSQVPWKPSPVEEEEGHW